MIINNIEVPERFILDNLSNKAKEVIALRFELINTIQERNDLRKKEVFEMVAQNWSVTSGYVEKVYYAKKPNLN